MSLDREQLFAIQREVLQPHSDKPDAKVMGEYGQRIPVAAEQGEGFFDFHHFDQLLLGRADCLFKQNAEFENNASRYHYGIHIALSGETRFSLSDSEQTLVRKSPEIWLIKGSMQSTRANVAANERIRNILIELSPDFIRPLGCEAHRHSLCQQLISSPAPTLMRLLDPSAETINWAWQLFDYPSATTYLQLMALQGASFTFVSHLLNLQQQPRSAQTFAQLRAEYARELLDKDYAKHWSIPLLARKSGINECDLKREFKGLTGLTINHYLRQQRMRAAMTMLERGQHNLLQIADGTGYNSKDYFIRVFRDFYGFHPKVISS